MRAVRFDEYGGLDQLKVVDVPTPEPGPGQVLVQVRAAGINPGEEMIRAGLLQEQFPATFPSGEGRDLAGTVAAMGRGVVGFTGNEDVIGYTDDQASHAEYVLVEADHLIPKPAEVPWEVAGSLFVAGATAYAALRAVSLAAGETVVVAGATGGVGSIAVQLARLAGATVIGIASQAQRGWLERHGVIPVEYGPGVADRIRQAVGVGHIDAFIDTVGKDYVRLALDLGIEPARINTTIDFSAAAEFGAQAQGLEEGASAGVLADLAGLVDKEQLEVPIAVRYPLTEVSEAYSALERGGFVGKIVLIP
jgi:NADPH:quinone reductase-like Zn-dependent oxidoreductase